MHWGGSFEVENHTDEEKNREAEWMDRGSLAHQNSLSHNHNHNHINHHDHLDETQQSWLLYPQEKKKKKYIDLGCIVVSHQVVKYTLWGLLIAFCVIALPTIIVKSLPKHKVKPPPSDNYTIALHKALLFFNAQKSGKLPNNNKISWRGNSGLKDGNELTDVKGGLVGGYYDAGDNTKFHFPMAYAMTMLSWSVIEYSHKYEAIKEYDHARELIKWGTDYLLLTFNSSAKFNASRPTAHYIDKVYSQVGGSQNGSTVPDDHTCWERPEDMDYKRPVQTTTAGPDLAGEIVAALAAASIVFNDQSAYSKKLVNGAEVMWTFARDEGKRRRYSTGNPYIDTYYNSTGYYDEYMWGGAWLYYATGKESYLSLVTNPGISKNSKAFYMIPSLSVPSWDNKLPSAMLLLTRFRIFLSPGYPYEDMLHMYHNVTILNMCSYLEEFKVFNFTRGGMIQLNSGKPQNLQYVANAAFLTSIFVDYLNASDVPGINCGPTFISSTDLRNFAVSQMDYILGKNPKNTSYVVGYGNKFPRHVHHRGASIPNDKKKYTCKGGYKWRDNGKANPNNITGAMVGGPVGGDGFNDVRSNYNYTEPTLAGNAALVAALVSLTSSAGTGIDKNTIFSAVPPLYPNSPPPPAPWKP